MSSPSPSTLIEEEDLKSRLSRSKQGVTDIQISTSKTNDLIQQCLVHLFQAKLSTLSTDCRGQLEHFDSEMAHHPMFKHVKENVEKIYSRSNLLQAYANSLCDAKEADGKIADFQFEIFTPPHGITEWSHWTSHQRKTRQNTLKHVEEAVGWWEELHNRGKAIQALVERVVNDLLRDISIVNSINEEQLSFRKSPTDIPAQHGKERVEAWYTKTRSIPARELQGDD